MCKRSIKKCMHLVDVQVIADVLENMIVCNKAPMTELKGLCLAMMYLKLSVIGSG